MTHDERIEAITARLQEAFAPTFLEVIDESHKHIGHEGAKSGLGHFKLRICADALKALPEIKAHRAIYGALGDLMTTDIHALSIEMIT